MSIKGSRYVTRIYATIRNCGPFHIGSGERGMLLDSETGMPYIPATSIAGPFRSYVDEIENDKKLVERCFGRDGEDSLRSKVFFYDAIGEEVDIELRPGLKINEKTGSAYMESQNGNRRSGHKFEREFLGTDHEFEIKIEVFAKDEEENKILKETLYMCLIALDKKHIHIGGYKTSGAGEFDVLKVEEEEYDMQSKIGLFDYISQNGTRRNITKEVKQLKLKDSFAEFNIICNIDKPILVKGINSNESDNAESVNIKNNKGQYIIPGSGLKGVLRNHCRRIEDYFNSKELTETAFGYSNDKIKEKHSGRVFVSDIIIDKHKDAINYNRIKIDKFTGGTITGSKFAEKPIVSQDTVNIKIKYKSGKDKAKDKAIIGMLILALRDIGVGNIPIGSGSNVGRGRLQFGKMDINFDNKKLEVDFINKTVSEKDYVNMLIKSITNNREVWLWI